MAEPAMNRFHPNVVALLDVARHLEELCEEVVFLGGATVALFLSDVASGRVRATQDVDCVVEVASTAAYYELDRRLRAKGFVNDQADAVICRYRWGHRILDVMPTGDSVLGFASRWARDAATHSERRVIDGVLLRVVTSTYLLATKIEAYLARGQHDRLTSPDLEDIVALFDGRSDLVGEVHASAPDEVRTYLRETLGRLLSDASFPEAISAHLPSDRASQQRVPLVIERIREMCR